MLKIILIILGIPLILVFIWFKDGNLLGHAEGALPFYNLERYLQPTEYTWMEHPGLGNISLLTTSGKPTYIFLTFLQNNLKIPGFIIQAGVFYFLLASAGIGIYFLTKEFFPKLDNRYALLSVFFYWFSPLSITDVWNRFLLNYIFFFGALPVLLLIFVKGLNTKKYYYAPILTLLIGIYSYSLSTLVFTLLLWFLFVLFIFFFLITSKEKNNKWFYIKFLSFLLGLFIFTNSWWLTQLYSLQFQMSFNQTISNFSTLDNLQTLSLLSLKLGNLTDIFRLINASASEIIGLDWINFFNSPLAMFFEFLIIGTILFAIIKRRAEKSILILGGIFFLTVFLMKGINTPLGESYRTIFQTFSFLQVFRNPFEKFSFILNLVTSLLVGYGIFTFSHFIATKAKRSILLVFLFLLFLTSITIMGYPFFSGLVFTSNEPPTDNPNVGYKVKVPDYYKEASDFLESKGNNFRFIGFPLGDEGITYKWERGYSGVELPSTLFSTPGILFNTAVPYYHDLVPQLENLLLENDNFLSVADSLNIRFLLLRTDIDWQERNMKDPQALLKRMNELEKKGSINKVGQYGTLTLWENPSWKDYTFYGASKTIISLPENINSYNIIPDIFNGEVTSTRIPDELTRNNLISKIVINTSPNPNPQNLDYESYSLKIVKEDDYKIEFTDLANYDPKILLDKKLVSINSTPLTTFNPVHLKEGVYQIIVNNLHSENKIELSKVSDSKDSRGYFKNFELADFTPNIMYLLNLNYQLTTNQKLIIYIFQDNDKIRNGEKITPFNLNLDPYKNNNFIQLNSFFSTRPSATSTQVSLLSDQPIDLSALQSLSVTKLVKPKPFLVTTNTNVAQSILPQVSYKKINATKYTVHIANASSPFILVFSELFNNKWEAFYKNSFPITSHFRVNIYANGWLVDKSGNFDINIEFTPQQLYRKGEILALSSHILNGIIFVTLMIKQRRKINLL